MTSYKLTHFKKVVRVWKTKSPLFCLRYDPLIVFRRQNHTTFIFIKMMSHDLLVQMAYFALNCHLNSLNGKLNGVQEEWYAWVHMDQKRPERTSKPVKLHCFGKDPTVVHLLFTATCSRMNSPVNQTNRFFHGFLFYSVEITLLKQLFTSGSVNIVE